MDKKQKIKKILTGTIKDFVFFSTVSSIGVAFLFGVIYLIYLLLKPLTVEVSAIIIMIITMFLISLLYNINKYL